MLIDANLTPKLWPHAAHDVVLIYNNLLHSALDDHMSPNDAYGDSSDFRKFCVFGSICYALQLSKLLHKLVARSAKGLFLGIHPTGYEALGLQSKAAYVARTVKVLDGKFFSTQENHIHRLCREELRKPKHILGVRVEFVNYEISLSQRQNIEEIVRTFSFNKGKRSTESFWILKMKNSILICTARSSKI